MKNLIFKQAPIGELIDADDKSGIVKGYASIFNNIDSDNDIIRKGAYKKDGEILVFRGKAEISDAAEYQGRKVTLNKPMKGDVKKSKVYVKDPKTGNVKKVNFGDPNMKIKKSNPKRRKSFRARHNCDNPGPKTKARYWSCKAW